ncbi:MAG TPA: putative transporter [Candidatus Enterocola sp.]|jgi:putative transport protein|nr:putative transporter [Candidatus Enterocola sp.]HPG55350.1 putative transporter [Candidatus Enterocola sp.]
MEWLINLLTNESIAHTLLLYSFIIAFGVFLGKVKIFGISLGVTFVLFVGIIVGHFGFTVNSTVLEFIKEFGLILFIYTIGLQVGPGFFSSFKKGGMVLNTLACGIVILGIITAISIYYIANDRIPFPMIVGIMSGAVTNTPGLGAAEEALRQIHYTGSSIGLGYAVAYPLGVVGIILSMVLIRVLFRIKLDNESEKLISQDDNAKEVPERMTLKITNKAIEGKTMKECRNLVGRDFIISRMIENDTIVIPAGNTVLHTGNIILVVTTSHNAESVRTFLGEEIEYKWEDDDSKLVSRRIVITQDSINGKTIGSLKLRSVLGVNITRVNRSGIDLLATPSLILQVGDRVMVVGPLDAIKRAEKILGNTLKRLNEPHIISIFIGILTGILVGSIPFYFPGMPMPAKLGLAGGPLIVAILVGRFGYKIKLITFTTQSANLMLREIGICLFLASVGLSSGSEFFKTVLSGDGLLWIGCGFLITIIPAIIIGIISRSCFKLNYYTIMGLIAGSMTDPPALAYASSTANNDAPAIAYSTVYPLTMFLRIISAQVLILAFA